MLRTSLAALLLVALSACAYIHPGPPDNGPSPGGNYNPVSHEVNESAR